MSTDTPAFEPIVWMDIETTGLVPTHDIPLEVAVAVTDNRLNIMWAIESLVIDPASTDGALFKKFLDTDSFVRTMHMKSDLIPELVHSRPQPINAVEARLMNFLKDYHIEKAPLAGSSVSFDRGFLQHWFPRYNSQLHYRNIDVSSFKEFLRRLYPETCAKRPTIPDEDKAHRAWPDLQASIEELAWYVKNLLPDPHQDTMMAALI